MPVSQHLKQFIDQLRQAGELFEIDTPVSTHLEITEITDRISKSAPDANKALLFNRIKKPDSLSKGETAFYEMPLLINALGSHKRMLMALGVDDYKTIQDRINFFIKPDIPTSLWEKIQMLPKLAELNQFLPKPFKGNTAPCQTVVITDPQRPMLDAIPVITCWPEDGGPFMTLPCVFVKDLATGERNVGMYRMQKYDNTTTGMHWHKHHDGNRIYENARKLGKDRVEVAAAFGCAPHVVYSATAPLPPGIDEMILAGFLARKPVEMVKCITIDNEVPATAELVIEGYVLLDEVRWEGPFGDHTGYYSLADDFPVFHVTAITHQKNPIYQTTIVGKPPQEDCYLGKATERIFLPLLKLFIAEIVDMNLPWEGVFHNCVILSIDKRYPGHAKKVMSSVWGFGQMMFSKYVIVVDKTIDVHDLSVVAWHVFNNTDPKRDMMFADGPMDILDHATPLWAYGSKVGIDATKKWPEEGFNRDWPNEIEMDQETTKLVTEKWSAYFETTR
ncbi:MAG: menaquinone biosynthesis decarboxylase [Cyanobacteria bacterium P01_H01_bin.74]